MFANTHTDSSDDTVNKAFVLSGRIFIPSLIDFVTMYPSTGDIILYSALLAESLTPNVFK
jgi:hypothetical protein